jgi:hypothetical protein
MSQITKTAQAPVKPRTSDEFYGRAITATIALAAAIIVVAFLLTRGTAAVPAGAAGGDQLTDGFLPGAIAAHTAQQLRNAQAVNDGWQGSLVGPMRAAGAQVRDGWEAGILAPSAAGHDVADGWESSLLK